MGARQEAQQGRGMAARAFAPGTARYTRERLAATLRRTAQRGMSTTGLRNRGVMSVAPTVTAEGTTLPAALTNANTYAAKPGVFRLTGGAYVTNVSRVKSAIIWTTGGNLGNNDGGQCSVSRVETWADCTEIAFRVTRSAARYRFLVDDQYVDATGTLTTSATPTSTNEYISLTFASRALRKIAIELQGDNGFIGAYVGPTESLQLTDGTDYLRSSLLGDSYVGGTAATALGDAFGLYMADLLGIRAHSQSGSGGTGWATSNSAYRFDQRIANGDLALGGTPDLIFLMGSYNDRANTAATITANTLAGLLSARALYPLAPIFVFGAFPGNTGPSAGIIAAENAVFSAVDSFGDMATLKIPASTITTGALISGTGKVGTTTSVGNSDIYTDSDGIHPVTVGHAYIGRWAAGAVLQAMNAAGW